MNDPEILNNIIRSRRSFYPKSYTGEMVDDSIINEILENAIWAPTHKLTQPWSFTVFTGQGRQVLAELQSQLYKKVSTEKGEFKEEKFKSLLEKPMTASHIIAIGMKRDPKVRIPEIEEISSVACAVQNIYLSASNYGLGCYWGTGGITYFDEAKEHFGLGPEDRLMGFFYIGVKATDREIPSKRIPKEEKVNWIRGGS